MANAPRQFLLHKIAYCKHLVILVKFLDPSSLFTGRSEFKSQGSYAMRLMVQHDERKYDIDDGVYFSKEDLVGPRGGDMGAAAAREMVRHALDDGSFKKAPECRSKCVRVYYDAGYHVDI